RLAATVVLLRMTYGWSSIALAGPYARSVLAPPLFFLRGGCDYHRLFHHRRDRFGGVERPVKTFVDKVIVVRRNDLSYGQPLAAHLNEHDVPGAQVQRRARRA